jgi:hypothetical protein
MVRFEVNKVINGRTGIKNLYAIHGSNETGEPKFLIVGSQVGENNKLPVIDITSSFHDTCYYFEDTPAVDVCEDFGIEPQTAHYIDSYDDFELVLRYDKRGD